MKTFELKFRVRYSETDRMGYVYYAHYAQYFEVTRVEMFRNLGIYYKELEDSGILLPVVNYSIRFFKPAYYDDEIVVKAAVKNPPMASIRFNYETVNAKGEIINCADTTLAFIDKKSEKPMRAPAYVIEKFCL